jgi:hypothetical protein
MNKHMKKIHLSIPEPCHENWDQMVPDEKGKFCNSCQNTVIDFTSMNDTQLVQFFKNYSGSVCGHVMNDQLHRDIIIPKKRIPWLRYFFQFTIPAMLISSKAVAQGKVAFTKNPIECKVKGQVMGMLAFPEKKTHMDKTIKGNVTDEKGKPIPGATIIFKNTNRGVVTDTSGNFEITSPVDSTPIVVSMVGFISVELYPDSSFNNIQLNPFIGTLNGEVVVVGAMSYKPEKVPLIQKIKDSVFTNFSVFPNPVKRNSTLNIRMNRFKKGTWKIELFNNAGVSLRSKDVDVDSKSQLIQFDVASLPAGVYFIRMKDLKSEKMMTEKVVIE